MPNKSKSRYSNIINLYLVRHAETVGMREGVRLGNDDGLSPNGINQAVLLSDRLANIQFSQVYCSPTLRAKQSLEIIQKTNPSIDKVTFDKDLVERREATSLIGVKTENMPWDYLKKHRLKRKWRYEDSESFQDIYDRSIEVLKKLAENGNESNVLVITHGSFIRALFATILLGNGLTPRQYFQLTEKLNIFASAISKLEYSQKYYEDKPSWKIITWMDTAHLESHTF